MHDTPLTFEQWRKLVYLPAKKPEPDMQTAQAGDFVYAEGWNECVDAMSGGGGQ